MITLKTQFNFDSAHRLIGYKGACVNIHGHIWEVELEIKGTLFDLDEIGMLWDFTNAKKIKKIFDHKTILKKCDENVKIINAIRETCGIDSVFLMNENPTAEHLAFLILQFLEIGNKKLKFKVKVYESPKSSAEVSSE